MPSVTNDRVLLRFRSYRDPAVAVLLAVAFLGAATAAAGPDPDTLLGEAERLAGRHRYREVVELLEPLETAGLDPAQAARARLILGRASFHLGRYFEAYDLLQGAGDGLLATVYLEASAYLTGRTSEARALLAKVLEAGEVDLYLAVTLPGERGFLGDREVWEVLANHARRFPVAVGEAAPGLRLGAGRDLVAASVPCELRAENGGRRLLLQAGPQTVLELELDPEDRLGRVVIDADALLRYTPLRLELAEGLGWWSAPDDVVERLGAPASFRPLAPRGVRMEWPVEGGWAALEFGPHGPARPEPLSEGRAMLRRLELWTSPAANAP